MFTRLHTHTKKNTRGFTLVELLIVIAILGLLASILVVVLNPAEMLRRTRDTQRISDLGSLNNALVLYTATATTPNMNGQEGTTACADSIFTTLADTTAKDTAATGVNIVQSTTQGLIDGTGWVPVDTTDMRVVATYPIDPINVGGDLWGAPAEGVFYYMYMCDFASSTYKLSARLESEHFTTTDPVMTRDGGVCDNMYEVGSDLSLALNGTATCNM